MVREPIPDLKRKRLEKVFEVAKAKAAAATKPNDFDYATSLLSQCIDGDIGNANYVRAYLENLQKKHGSPKKIGMLAQFQELGSRNAVKKAVGQEQWDDVIRHGLKVLAVNPWDMPALVAMATAANKSGDRDCELCYLMSALKGTPKNPALNRLYAIAMGERGLIDEAITFWHRVEEASPGNEEASRSISVLMVQKSHPGGQSDEADDRSRQSGRKGAAGRGEFRAENAAKNPRQPQRTFSLFGVRRILHERRSFQRSRARVRPSVRAFRRRHRHSGEVGRLPAPPCLRQKVSQAKDRRDEEKAARPSISSGTWRSTKAQVARYPEPSQPQVRAWPVDTSRRGNSTRRFGNCRRRRPIPAARGLCMLALGECFPLISKQYQTGHGPLRNRPSRRYPIGMPRIRRRCITSPANWR